MTRINYLFLKNPLIPLLIATLLSRLIWAPFLFNLSGREFFTTAVLNVILLFFDFILLILYKKISKLFLLTIYVLSISAFCIIEAHTSKMVCGMEYCIFACVPGLFMFSTEMKTKRRYFLIMDTLLIGALSYLTWLKLSRLPPQQLFLPERRLFMTANEIFYTVFVVGVLLYGSLLTDFTLRRYTKKNEYLQFELNNIAKHDPLTGLMNRRRTHEVFERLNYLKQADNKDYAIAIFDIDDFKKINDTWGHDAGDFILKTFSKRVLEYLSEPVKVGRWGGEEFLILFPEIDDNTVYLLEGVRQKITEQPVIYDGKTIKVTATFGISSSRNFSTPEAVLSNADEYLYIGKQNGKDRLVVSEKF